MRRGKRLQRAGLVVLPRLLEAQPFDEDRWCQECCLVVFCNVEIEIFRACLAGPSLPPAVWPSHFPSSCCHADQLPHGVVAATAAPLSARVLPASSRAHCLLPTPRRHLPFRGGQAAPRARAERRAAPPRHGACAVARRPVLPRQPRGRTHPRPRRRARLAGAARVHAVAAARPAAPVVRDARPAVGCGPLPAARGRGAAAGAAQLSTAAAAAAAAAAASCGHRVACVCERGRRRR